MPQRRLVEILMVMQPGLKKEDYAVGRRLKHPLEIPEAVEHWAVGVMTGLSFTSILCCVVMSSGSSGKREENE